MRHELKATRDVQQTIGDRVFNNTKGETIEISAAGAEIALSSLMDGAYEHVREIPETPEEEKRLAFQSELAKARATKKETLVRQASKLDIEGAGEMLKDPLAEAVAGAKVDDTEKGAKK